VRVLTFVHMYISVIRIFWCTQLSIHTYTGSVVYLLSDKENGYIFVNVQL